MKKSNLLLFIILLNLHSLIAVGQTNEQQIAAQQQQQFEIQKQQQQQQQIERQRQYSEMQILAARPATAPSRKPNYSPPSVKLSTEQKAQLKPDSQDLSAYGSFLKLPKTGMIKLFNDFGCAENSFVVKVDEKCLKQIPNSEFYSFRRNKYINETLADIRYKNGFILSDGLLTQGLMTNLGDVLLEKVSFSDNWAQSLNAYQPESQNRKAEIQSKKLLKGIKLGDNIYQNRLPASFMPFNSFLDCISAFRFCDSG